MVYIQNMINTFRAARQAFGQENVRHEAKVRHTTIFCAATQAFKAKNVRRDRECGIVCLMIRFCVRILLERRLRAKVLSGIVLDDAGDRPLADRAEGFCSIGLHSAVRVRTVNSF